MYLFWFNRCRTTSKWWLLIRCSRCLSCLGTYLGRVVLYVLYYQPSRKLRGKPEGEKGRMPGLDFWPPCPQPPPPDAKGKKRDQESPHKRRRLHLSRLSLPRWLWSSAHMMWEICMWDPHDQTGPLGRKELRGNFHKGIT